jgi:hypothetical protein
MAGHHLQIETSPDVTSALETPDLSKHVCMHYIHTYLSRRACMHNVGPFSAPARPANMHAHACMIRFFCRSRYDPIPDLDYYPVFLLWGEIGWYKRPLYACWWWWN